MDKELLVAFNKVTELNEEKDQVKVSLPLSLLVTLTQASQGQRVKAVNDSIEKFVTKLMKNESLAPLLDISILTSQQHVNVLRPQLPVEHGIAIPLFSAKGHDRTLAQGLDVAINMLRSKVAANNQAAIPCRRPWLIAITDGQGTDVWQDTATQLKHLSEEKVIIPIIINIGQYEESLNAYSVFPTSHCADGALDEMFVWLEECLLMVVNAQQGQTVRLPSPPIVELS